jgi:hypothetical protein
LHVVYSGKFSLELWGWLQLQLVVFWAEAHDCDLVSLIRFLSDGLATSPGFKILVLKGYITQLGGKGVLSDFTRKDVP